MKKIGFDIHGVIDFDPDFFSGVSRKLIEEGNEVHIITGASKTKEVIQKLSDFNIEYTHFFSIVDWCVDNGIDVGDPLNPKIDDFIWDSRKAMYCRDFGIDVHIDDTPRYAIPFKTICTRFVLYEQSVMNMNMKVRQVIASVSDCDNYPCNKSCPQYILYKDKIRNSIVNSNVAIYGFNDIPYDWDEAVDELVESIMEDLI